MKSSGVLKHKSFQSVLGVGQNLKRLLGQRNCPYVQSAIDIFHAFEPISETRRQILIAGALDENCRIIQWDLLATDEINTSKFSADLAMISALNHDASRIFLVHNLVSKAATELTSMFGIGRTVAEACALMGYEFVDHVAICGNRFFSLFEYQDFASFVKCTSATRIRSGDQQNWSWPCAHCRRPNLSEIAAMKGHSERPIQYARCSFCEEHNWLTILPINRESSRELQMSGSISALKVRAD